MRYLSYFTNNISCVYHQRSQGHGISVQVIPEDINLLIIVDSSTNEVDKTKELCENNIEVIILDHHPKTVDNPYAIIVNPQLDSSPNKSISGAGVVFKTCQVLDNLLDVEYASQFIDLAGIGMYADVMSMSEPENRYLVYQALKNISNLGIKAIIQKNKVNSINSETIAYKIAPVINACGRMDKIEKIIELLLEDDYDKCLLLAKECVALNEERKKLQAKLFKKVKDRIDTSHKIIIVRTTDHDKIEKGFNGLLATQISEKYKKPVLVVKDNEGMCAGSGRGIGDIQLKEILNDTKLFKSLEGHNQAFGCEFDQDNLEGIYNYLDENLKDQKQDAKIIEYDIELDKEIISKKTIEEIQQFNYLAGKNCEVTKFMIKNLVVYEIKVMGKMLDTVKIRTDVLDLMKFRVNEFYADDLCEGDLIDVIGSVNKNRWWNFQSKQWVENLQMFIDDYKLSSI
jgi:single-stranded-DNA-specific exonuclease